ncbi:MAG: flavodoxin-dependent (E)-4-hydroxy-3-methylbut-2-enyl-diphosphate synthase [Bacillota bacterium]|nr:flavodoxin-dependent (E)-4-hydroxy-3-methylbut-2-enyl-diphosphate synthase [Bacillota bacterium]
MRKNTRQVRVGRVLIGGGAPVSVQSMANTDTLDISATTAQVRRLKEAGCDIVRVSIYDEECAKTIRAIKESVDIPIVADIHFDYKLAILAAKSGADKLRINPGNIGSAARVRELALCAKDMGIPIRVGANSGSIKKEFIDKYGGVTAEALVESALEQVSILENSGFTDIVVSIKASDVVKTVESYRMAALKMDYPLHIGVTEAGFGEQGLIKSSIGIGTLLLEGIGDTLRVSLTGDPVHEVRAGREILRSIGMLPCGLELISCPTCARCKVDLESICRQLYEKTRDITKPLCVAVMGCAVNGPGEASHADLGVACGKGEGLIFVRGVQLKKVKENEIVKTLVDIIKSQ